jgi:hypothetical protein
MIDDFLKLPNDRLKAGGELWSKLREVIEELRIVVKEDSTRSTRFEEIETRLQTSASKLAKSMSVLNGPLAEDWKRLARNDLETLKDELVALQEFIVSEREFLKHAFRRVALRKAEEVDPKRLFEELHEARAISERTWALVVSHPAPLRANKSEISQRLRNLAWLLLELQGVRSSGTERRKNAFGGPRQEASSAV